MCKNREKEWHLSSRTSESSESVCVANEEVKEEEREWEGVEGVLDTSYTALTVSISHLTDVPQAEQTPFSCEGQAEVSGAVGEAQRQAP